MRCPPVRTLGALAFALGLAACGDSGIGTAALLPTAPPAIAPPPGIAATPVLKTGACERRTFEAAPLGALPVAPTSCLASSWVAGSSAWCAGRLVYRDYVYDDYGADTGATTMPLGDASLAPSAGDARYAAGAENTADLVRLELAVLPDGTLGAEWELNTLYDPAQTKAALAIDCDNDPATGGGELPGFGGVTAPGWDQLVTFSKGDASSNSLRGAFTPPEGASWRVFGVVAQADGTVMNVAFRGIDEKATAGFSLKAPETAFVLPGTSAYWDELQAAALGKADIGAFAQGVRTADFTEGRTQAASVGPGLHQRVYTSAYTLPPGEGIAPDGVPGSKSPAGSYCAQLFHYLGQYQPYAFYLPSKPGPHGLQLLLHGCSANHASLINQPGYQADVPEALGLVVVSPLGRGPSGFYSDLSERDALDVFADAKAHYAIDDTRQFIGGYSMGGYGTLRLAALYPHWWAGAMNWVGFVGNILTAPVVEDALYPVGNGSLPLLSNTDAGAVGNVYDLVQNLRHVPSVNVYSGGDELVQINTGLALQDRFRTAEVEQAFYVHPAAEHLTYAFVDDWKREAAFAAGRTLIQAPARVQYRTSDYTAYPEYGIRHDRAYWLADIRPAGEGYADLDVTSFGCGAADAVVGAASTTAGQGPVPLVWTLQSKTTSPGAAVAGQNRLAARLVNVASLTVELEGSCLSHAPIAYEVTSSTPVVLRFSDGRVLTLPAGSSHGSH